MKIGACWYIYFKVTHHDQNHFWQKYEIGRQTGSDFIGPSVGWGPSNSTHCPAQVDLIQKWQFRKLLITMHSSFRYHLKQFHYANHRLIATRTIATNLLLKLLNSKENQKIYPLPPWHC